MLSRLLLAAGLVIGLSASLQAQYGNVRHPQQQPGRQPVVAVKPVDIQGTIEGVARGGLAVIDSNSQPWRVVVPPAAKVEVTGGATADYLQTGLVVEFKAEIDGHGAIKEKVGELTIVSLSPEKQMGLFPADSTGEPGGVAAGAAAEGTADTKPAKRSKATAGKNATPAGTYRIVGKLTSGRGGKLSVQTGRSTLALELTEQPTVSVKSSDYLLAAKGDKVTVKGVMMANRPGMAQAKEVKIELAEPLAGAKKKGPAKSEAKRPAKRPTKDEGLPEPAADK